MVAKIPADRLCNCGLIQNVSQPPDVWPLHLPNSHTRSSAKLFTESRFGNLSRYRIQVALESEPFSSNLLKGISMIPQEFFLLLASVIASVMGQFLLKIGALKLGQVNTANALSHILSIVVTPELLMGLTCYAFGALAYILLLTRVELSVAGPSASLIYVFSVLLGSFFFKETIPFTRLIGLGCIVCGVILVVWQK